ncbi:unnamed protein product [Cylicocyclus nassatus]|uniref:Uncharacterized protein n=1 Tax=Cylicocyclus nassatus TaxID=53992 RepID=A0AA36GW51_CYLNA|nr:unnamed protein product [Cylicocyclus nassatus]
MVTKTSASSPIAVWMQKWGSYVESIPNILLRVKHPNYFGEDIRGIPDFSGDVMDVDWNLVMSLRPTVIEITHSRNPLSNLVAALKDIEQTKLQDFFARLKLLTLDRADISVDDLLFLLQKLKLLEGFSFSEMDFTRKDWARLLPEFQRLNIRAMEITNDILDTVLDKMNVELVKLATFPGVKVDMLKKCSATFVTVSTLVIQELDYTNDQDAEDLIACVETKFPRLKTLLWDWSVVDPAVTADERSKIVIGRLVGLFRKLKLQCFAIVTYTPDASTKYASGELARMLAEADLPLVQLHRFASKGLSEGQDNFTIITAGEDRVTRAKIHSIFVDGRTSAPDLRLLLQLIDDFSPSLDIVRTVEFGGFDADYVKKTYDSKKNEDQS